MNSSPLLRKSRASAIRILADYQVVQEKGFFSSFFFFYFCTLLSFTRSTFHCENFLLLGVKQDGSVSHFFHRTFKAYNTGTRKRRKINSDELGDVRWHKTGKTKPVIIDGKHVGCKKIMVLYMSTVKGGKAEKTNWVMHQHHLGIEEDEKDGEYVVSKLFYQQQSKPGERSAQDLRALDTLEAVVNEVEPMGIPALLPEGHDDGRQDIVHSPVHDSNQGIPDLLPEEHDDNTQDIVRGPVDDSNQVLFGLHIGFGFSFL